MVQNGLVKLLKHAFFTGQVFVVVAFDHPGGLHATVKNVSQKVDGEGGKQAVDTGQAGKLRHISQAEFAQSAGGQVVEAVGFFHGQETKANVQVALDGAQVHVEFIGQPTGVEFFALIEFAKDLGEAVAQGVSFRGGVHAGLLVGVKVFRD